MKLVSTFCAYALFVTFNLFSQETIIIPDIGLEEALIDLDIDSNGLNGNILVSDAKYVVNLNINNPLENKLLPNVNSKIKDLTGIEYFTNLKRLDCYGNEITKIDLSKNTEITFLNCSDNKIVELDLSNNNKLISVSCDTNKLVSLTLGKQPNLVDLFCNSNLLESLNIENCNSLENFDASGNKINTIVINQEAYNKSSEGWYKDEKTVYKTNLDAPIVATKNVISDEVSIAKPIKKIEKPVEKTYDEAFKKLIVAEYEKRVLEEAYLRLKKEEVQRKYNLSDEKITEWIDKYSKLPKVIKQ
ncbi:hypothetical protein [Tenacibaculum sp. 190524A02b]|uniref:hypothetical protein n=1 Tax=Tenacibaculum vairaonense TaxID=3137860 RepID=UPI0031FA910A